MRPNNSSDLELRTYKAVKFTDEKNSQTIKV